MIFLGMDIKLHRKSKRIEIGMVNQLQETIDLYKSQFGSLETRYTSPAGHHLFVVNHEGELLDENKKELFHTITAKLLYIMKRGQPDIELAISFLCTRVKDPNIDD